MSYWHSKIPALTRNSNPNVSYYIYYGKEPICRVYFFVGSDVLVAFGRQLVGMQYKDDDRWPRKEDAIKFIFRNLKGTNRVDSLEQRAASFAVKCKLTNELFESITTEREE